MPYPAWARGVFGFVVVWGGGLVCLGFVCLLVYHLFFIYLFNISPLECCHIHFFFVDIFAERYDKVDICIRQL